MARNKQLFLSVLLLTVILVGVFGWKIFSTHEKLLDKSVQAVLGGHDDKYYRVLMKSYNDSYIDPGGEWWLYLNDTVKFTNKIKQNFTIADDADLQYFKKVIYERFERDSELDNYKLYRAEFSLGKDTICETTPCNIYILHTHDNNNVYIGLYKN